MSDDAYAPIGAMLKSAREEQSLSPEHVARTLHMRIRYVHALEEGKFSELPGLAYTKGYLQAYAGFLQLDKVEIIRRFEQMEGPLVRKGFYFPQVISREKKPTHQIILASLVVAFFGYALWATFLKPQAVDIAAVEEMASRPRPLPDSYIMLGDVACLKLQTVLYPPCQTQVSRVWLPTLVDQKNALKAQVALVISEAKQKTTSFEELPWRKSSVEEN